MSTTTTKMKHIIIKYTKMRKPKTQTKIQKIQI